jgi:ABC-type oligopeptide transport system substrate-binding subunit
MDAKGLEPGPWLRQPSNPGSGDIVLVPNTSYKHHRFEQVRFVIFPSQAQAVTALLAGQVDFLPTITHPAQQARLKADNTIHVEELEPRNVHYLGFKRAPIDVRRTVAATLLPLATLLAGNIGQYWKVADDILPPGFPGKIKLGTSVSPDVKPPLPLHFKSSADPGYQTVDHAVATAIQLKLAAAGVTIHLHPHPTYRELLNSVIAASPPALFLYNWFVKDKKGQDILRPLFKAASDHNLTGWTDPTIEALDDNSGAEAVKAAVLRVAEDIPVLPLYHLIRVAAWPESVKLNVDKVEGNPPDRLLSGTPSASPLLPLP